MDAQLDKSAQSCAASIKDLPLMPRHQSLEDLPRAVKSISTVLEEMELSRAHESRVTAELEEGRQHWQRLRKAYKKSRAQYENAIDPFSVQPDAVSIFLEHYLSRLAAANPTLRHESKVPPTYEPEILGYLNGTAVAFFPDNQSAHDIISHDYAKRNHLKIDSSRRTRMRTAKGSHFNTLGTVLQPIHFAEEPEIYMREFHVLPKCVHDIILGGPFLSLTQTFTKFAHRVVKKLRGLSSRHRVCSTGSSQQMLAGWANGQSVLALPDTGSDICLMSLRYACERGYRIDTDPKHRELMEFVDGSTAETCGRVEGFQWEFDRSDIQVHTPEIHVLENLQTDLLLGYEFLENSDAFVTHEELFIDAEPHDERVGEMFGWLVSAIKLVTSSKTWGYGRQFAQKLGWKSPTSGMFSSMGLDHRMATLLLTA
jgi:hypothetical protein